MAKFQFPFMILLNLKAKLVDKSRNELGQAIQKLEKSKKDLSKIEKEMEVIADRLRKNKYQSFTVRKFREYGEYLSFLKKRQEIQKLNVKKEEINVDSIRGELLKLEKEREILERLRKRKLDEFMYKQLKTEQKLVDEIINFKQKTIAGDMDA
jgi:flagellar protein FliJ